jgi:hypothetical protein
VADENVIRDIEKLLKENSDATSLAAQKLTDNKENGTVDFLGQYLRKTYF